MSDPSRLPELLAGFETRRIRVRDDGAAGAVEGEIHVRIAGAGPPLVALHGYPQTHVCWHRIAPALARQNTLVLIDLRGYGQSFAPPGDSGHRRYSKRAMAADVVQVMSALGHDRFAVMGHDRGARVAYRLALDHPSRVTRLLILDILPTLEVFERMRWQAALASYHWLFLAQPSPVPENLIAGMHEAYLDHTLAGWTAAKSLAPFDPRALAHYRALLADPARRHAVTEDYRAGVTIDRELDAADRDAGRRIAAPTHVLWGRDYLAKAGTDVLGIWRGWADQVTGAEIASGHFLAEEQPEATLAAISPFAAGT